MSRPSEHQVKNDPDAESKALRKDAARWRHCENTMMPIYFNGEWMTKTCGKGIVLLAQNPTHAVDVAIEQSGQKYMEEIGYVQEG